MTVARLLVLSVITASVQGAHGSTITVTNTADAGPGTLRNALSSAADGDTIKFSLASPARITLTSGELLITKNVTINGPGAANVAVDGNAASRVFRIGSNTVVTISGLTITNGHSSDRGGGIRNDHATLTIRNCTVAGNSTDYAGGGIFSDGEFGGNASLTVSNCTLSGNSSLNYGGGIFNNGYYGNASMLVTHSTLNENWADYGGGGGIWNGGVGGNGNLQVVASTLSGNSAHFASGGGIANDGHSGSASLQIVNTTLSGNSSGFGGGAIYNWGQSGTATLQIGSTILNASALGADILNDAGTISSLGFNLSSDDASGFLTSATDQINTDPRLGPLQDNGGPTFTHVLLCGSSAIDKGKNLSALTTDQRGSGFVRTFDNDGVPNATNGDGTDIGAIEFQPDANSFVVLNTSDSGLGSLRQAILNANAHPGPDVIEFVPCLSGTILLTSGELLISDEVFINGPGAPYLAVDGNAASRVFHIGSNMVATITGLTITNGLADFGGGGGIFNDNARLTVNNCTLIGNNATFGGGIYNEGLAGGSASLAVNNSKVSGNFGRSEGGGILCLGNSVYFDPLWRNGHTSLIVSNSALSGNATYGHGGGIANWGRYPGSTASVEIVYSTLGGNSADFDVGGGIWNLGDSGGSASVKIANSTISGNSAQSGGGFESGTMGMADANLQVMNSTLSGNLAAFGGGIEIIGGTLTVGSTLLNAGGYGENLVRLEGNITSLGFNLSSDDGSGFLTSATDQINTDPRLGPLQDNGGPTFTHALTCRSPAIDAGKNFGAAATDQRGVGFGRTFDDPAASSAAGGDGTDIGAFEAQQPLPVCDRPPVADASATVPLVISPNGSNATVILDGSRSSDSDGDFLQYYWSEAGHSLASGVVAVAVLPVGTHTILLVVNDGTLSDTNVISIEVITASEAVNRLAATLNSDVSRAQPLAAVLRAALASIDRSNPTSALNQLMAFQNQIRAQVAPIDATLAQMLIAAAQEIMDALSAPVARCLPAPSGLIGWWAGENNANDSVDGNPGILNNGASFTAGKVGQAFSFDGNDDFVQATTTGFPTGNSDRTLEFWVRVDEFLPIEEAFFVGYGNYGSYDQIYHVGASSGRLFFSQWGQAIFGPVLGTNEWYHVAVSSVGNAIDLYLDGTNVTSGSLNIDTPAGTQMYFGTIPGPLGETRLLRGAIDEVSLYNRALSSAEIQAIYNAGSAGKCNSAGRPHRRITSLARPSNGHSRLQFTGEAGGRYIVEASTDFDHWEMIGVATGEADGSFAFEDPQTARFPQRFYRIVSP